MQFENIFRCNFIDLVLALIATSCWKSLTGLSTGSIFFLISNPLYLFYVSDVSSGLLGSEHVFQIYWSEKSENLQIVLCAAVSALGPGPVPAYTPAPAHLPQVLQHPPAVQFLVFLERFFHSRETEVGTVNLSFPTLPRYGHLHLMFTGRNCLLIRNIDIPSFTKADSFIYKIWKFVKYRWRTRYKIC